MWAVPKVRDGRASDYLRHFQGSEMVSAKLRDYGREIIIIIYYTFDFYVDVANKCLLFLSFLDNETIGCVFTIN